MPHPSPPSPFRGPLLGVGLLVLILLFPAACRTEASPEPPPGNREDADFAWWQDYRRQAREIERDLGVELRVDAEAEDFIPSGWRRRPIFGRAESIDAFEAYRVVPIVRQFLDAYPAPLIERELAGIHLARRLVFYRRSYGGTNSADTIYLSCRDESEGFDESYLLGTLHAEMSSILLRNHSELFDEAGFDATLPAGFSYSGTGVEVLHKRGLLELDAALLRLGFLSRYATSSRENDFNAFARWIQTRPEELRRLCEQHPLLAAKAAIVEEFFGRLPRD
jgi:hypothetical protein